ncbi:MAG TPA: hypothetical protein VHJ82_06010 [Actinomycetota bacterium]|nr:hypothetical protein [Actinomycetota bacterium]
MKKHRLAAVGLTGLLILGACTTGDGGSRSERAITQAAAPAADEASLIDRDEFRRGVRDLWEDHIAWTRLFIVSAVDGLADVDVTAERLLRNQTEIGDAIKPFFGDEAGKELTNLLNEHILIAADVISAAKKGDDKAVDRNTRAWYRNGNEIADFLADAGVGSRTDLRAMMKGHLDTTLDEAVARLSGDYRAEIEAYDEVRSHIHHMSDALAEGILAVKSSSGSYDY